MTLVHTREEALELVDSALAKFDAQVGGLLTQATAVAGTAVQQAEDVVRRCETKASALEALLAAAKEQDRRRVQAELIRAREQVDQARRARRQVADVSESVRALQRSYAQQSSPLIAAGRGYLTGLTGAVQEYLSGSGGGAGVAGVSSGRGGSARTGPGGLSVVLADLGLTMVSVTAADLDDTPIRDGFARDGLTRADYRWAVQTWNDTVGPGIDRGMTRNEFAARDNRDPAAPPLRQTAKVYDLFLGSKMIRANRRPDGSLDITNGYHRLQIARELGIKELPGRVFG